MKIISDSDFKTFPQSRQHSEFYWFSMPYLISYTQCLKFTKAKGSAFKIYGHQCLSGEFVIMSKVWEIYFPQVPLYIDG